MLTIILRFYEELNDFLSPEKRKVRFERQVNGRPAIKDVIESLGVPHTEVDLVLVNGVSVDFSYQAQPNDEISIYPVFESLDITPLVHLRDKPLREPRFVLDVHLGKLARALRMLGFDTLYTNTYTDEEIAAVAAQDQRIILTRNRGILKRKEVTHGYWVRSNDPAEQIREVVKRFDLSKQCKEFSRCLECNGLLALVDKKAVAGQLPERVKERCHEFYQCGQCRKVYWNGSHVEKMKENINKIKSEAK